MFIHTNQAIGKTIGDLVSIPYDSIQYFAHENVKDEGAVVIYLKGGVKVTGKMAPSVDAYMRAMAEVEENQDEFISTNWVYDPSQ
jgi:hypothetical protein